MTQPTLIGLYLALIVAASLLGGLIPLVLRLTHTKLQIASSAIAGFVLGIAVLLIIPHALMRLPVQPAMLALLVGFLAMFFIERVFSFHTHQVAELDNPANALKDTSTPDAAAPHDHTHAHHDHHHHHHAPPRQQLSWAGAAFGMGIHGFFEGIALAAAVAFEMSHQGGNSFGLAGLAVLMVILACKPLDALTVITLTASAGYSKPARHLINALFALAVPLGVAAFLLGLNHTTLGESGELVGYALAFSAGTFLCIALSDLLPELHFHSHDRAKLSFALILGVALAIGTAQLEYQFHDHTPTPGNDNTNTPPVIPHDDHNH